MQNYFSMISRKLTKPIIPYAKSEAALQIVSANGKTCKTLVPHVSASAKSIAKGVATKVPHWGIY